MPNSLLVLHCLKYLDLSVICLFTSTQLTIFYEINFYILIKIINRCTFDRLLTFSLLQQRTFLILRHTRYTHWPTDSDWQERKSRDGYLWLDAVRVHYATYSLVSLYVSNSSSPFRNSSNVKFTTRFFIDSLCLSCSYGESVSDHVK